MENTQDSGEEHVEAAVQQDVDNSTSVNQEEEKVPLSALQAERKQRQELQNNLKMMQDHLELLKQNKDVEQQQESSFSNLQDDDVLTVGEAKKYISNIQNDYKQSIEELRMQQFYPDYSETIRNYLPDVIKDNPELKDDIQRAKNPYKLAYFLAKKSDRYLSDKKQINKNQQAERILKNSSQSGNLSSVGQTSTKSAAKPWSQMSDKEFMAYANRHLG